MTPNAIVALQNAWTGALAATETVRSLDARVQALDPAAGIAAEDLETLHNAVLAQANAVMALRGLVEQLRRLQSAPA
jgi:hypothetical protein